jgi:beta-phosphoglucomutase
LGSKYTFKRLKVKAFIFDLDGTLVDTTPVYLAAYAEIMEKELGINPGKKKIKSQFGKNSLEIMEFLLNDMGIDPETIDIRGVVDRIGDNFVSNLSENITLPGVFELLDKLKGEYKLGLATSSHPYKRKNLLKLFKLEDHFDTIVTGRDVPRAKPDPAIFTLTAKKLGVAPEECVVFEDTNFGVDAAKAAGMRVVAVTTGACTREELETSKPDIIIDSLL